MATCQLWKSAAFEARVRYVSVENLCISCRARQLAGLLIVNTSGLVVPGEPGLAGDDWGDSYAIVLFR